MPIVLNCSVGVTTDRINVDKIYDEAGTGSPSVPNGFQEIYSIPIGCIIRQRQSLPRPSDLAGAEQTKLWI